MKTIKVITSIFLLIFIGSLLITLFGCSTEPEPIEIENKIDITGFYTDYDNGLELWVYQDYADPKKIKYEITIRWWQATTKLDGVIDREQKVLVASGNYQGIQNVSLNVWYGGQPLVLRGTFYYNLSVNLDVDFTFQHGLEKLNFHDQGELSNNNF